MAKNRNRLFYIEDKLNYGQRWTLDAFAKDGLTEADLLARPWFDRWHYRAFYFLVKKKQYTFAQAFAEVDQLTEDQAYAIYQGCNRAEVIGLDKGQLLTYLKYGLPKNDLQGLNEYQIKALRALKKHNIQADDLRKINPFKRKHLEALIFLVVVKKQSCQDALNSLQKLTSKEALAIIYGLKSEDVSGLHWHEIRALIKRKKLDGLQNREAVTGLSDFQISMVENLFHYGLTSDKARQFLLPSAVKKKDRLMTLVQHGGFTVDEMLRLQRKYNEFQLDGIIDGLTEKEIADLNPWQVHALIRLRTIKNQFTANDLRGKDWFNSNEHIDILDDMLRLHYKYPDAFLTVKEALAKMEGLTGEQAWYLVRQDLERGDVVGLSDMQLRALNTYEQISGKVKIKVTSQHLRGKDWFNSEDHVKAVRDLIVFYDMTAESAMKELDGFSSEQAKLLTHEWSGYRAERLFNRENILKLTPTQLKILSNEDSRAHYNSLRKFIEATWLKTDEQAELLKELRHVGALQGDEFVHAIVQRVCAKPEALKKALVKTIKEGKLDEEQLEMLASPVKPTKPWDAIEPALPSNCSIM